MASVASYHFSTKFLFYSLLEFFLQDEAEYVCGSCGEAIVIPVDFSSGSRQEYVEDCPVCCCANVISLEIDETGCANAWAKLE